MMPSAGDPRTALTAPMMPPEQSASNICRDVAESCVASWWRHPDHSGMDTVTEISSVNWKEVLRAVHIQGQTHLSRGLQAGYAAGD